MSVLTSHESVEWFTPPFYVGLVRAVLEEIDLDPASHLVAQEWIKARNARFVEGMDSPWRGRVFCNPPYGKENGKSSQAVWSAFMAEQYRAGYMTEGVLLVNSTHGYKWYEELWANHPVCCLRDRIRFVREDGSVGGQAKRGQTFVYFGERPYAFAHVFSPHGRIVFP